MILTGAEITREVDEGGIVISPFFQNQVNPNSYNYRLGNSLKISSLRTLDSHGDESWEELSLPPDGYTLTPGCLHLGVTSEIIGSPNYVPSLIGRSSLGRLGMYLQASADLGNLGDAHRWTLEIKVVQPLRIYPNMEIGQVTFWQPTGEIEEYRGMYMTFHDPTPFLMGQTG